MIHISIAVNKSETQKMSYGIHIKCFFVCAFVLVVLKKNKLFFTLTHTHNR